MQLLFTPSTSLLSIPLFPTEVYKTDLIFSLPLMRRRHGTFASLGGDAVVSVWDAAAKKRIRQYPKFDAPITAGSFDASGTLLCIATGSDSTEPTTDAKTSLILKHNAWEECKPKLKSSSTSTSSKSSSSRK